MNVDPQAWGGYSRKVKGPDFSDHIHMYRWQLFLAYWSQNLNLRHEVDGKLGLPVGKGLDEWPK